MPTNITSVSLDFLAIKNKLKTYLASTNEFRDYDFEASGINNILDVLAYNTHFNGLIANFAINESFLNTAQLRSSAVSHSEKLGYRPRSKISSTATLSVNINLASLPVRPLRVTLPQGFRFSASNDDNLYHFVTLQNYYAEDNGSGLYVFKDDDGNSSIKVYEGDVTTKTFILDRVSEDPLFVIPDEDMDVGTADVKVYESPTSSNYQKYSSVEKEILLSKDSLFYDIKEAPNGFYELNFGDGITFGKTPDAGNKIVVTYLSTSGEEGNGCIGFTPSDVITINGQTIQVNITSQTVSSSGANRESIESIRKLAPLQFATQKRLVTALDYKSMILQNYPVVSDVAVWGGEDNVPVDYGKVYISLQYLPNTSLQTMQNVEASIASNFTDQLSIMSITNQFVSPVETYMILTGNFNFDPTLTTQSPSTLQNLVHGYIINYFDNKLNRFSEEFRRSNLLAGIDSLDQAIVSSRIDVRLSQRFTPALGVKRNYDIYFPVRLSPPDKDEPIVKSSGFTYGISGVTDALIQNQLGSNVLQIVSPRGQVLLDNVGYYEYKLGRIRLIGFEPSTILSGNSYLEFTSIPLDQSVVTPLRNYVLKVDTQALFIKPIRNLPVTLVNL
jgi:hypothetical protein